MTVKEPGAVGSTLTVHVADALVPARAHVTLLTVTVPVGVLVVPTSVSVTVTVHVKAIPTVPVAGHDMVVVVVLTILNAKLVMLPS